MTITMNSDEIYYKHNQILELSEKNNIKILSSSDENNITTITFATEEDYTRALMEVCIIPIEHND